MLEKSISSEEELGESETFRKLGEEAIPAQSNTNTNPQEYKSIGRPPKGAIIKRSPGKQIMEVGGSTASLEHPTTIMTTVTSLDPPSHGPTSKSRMNKTDYDISSNIRSTDDGPHPTVLYIYIYIYSFYIAGESTYKTKRLSGRSFGY